MRVKVKRMGFFGAPPRRVREGDVIEVTEQQFSSEWMEPLAASKAAPAEPADPEVPAAPKKRGRKKSVI